MFRNVSLAALVLLLFALNGCGTLNNALAEKKKSVEYYRIFDIKTNAGRDAVIDAGGKGLGMNVGNANEARPIPSYQELPTTPGRFKVVDPLAGSKLAAFANAGGGLGMKMASCEGAIWTANARKDVNNSFELGLTTCLFEYKDGYHLDMYAHFTKEEGGLMQISRSMANAVVGTPEEWAEKTFLDVIKTIKQDTNAEVKFLEGYPKISGTPWLDSNKEAISTK